MDRLSKKVTNVHLQYFQPTHKHLLKTLSKSLFPVVFFANRISISSSDFPFVSGIQIIHTIAVTNVHPPNRKYAAELLRSSSTGVVSATRKLASQLLPYARFVALDLDR